MGRLDDMKKAIAKGKPLAAIDKANKSAEPKKPKIAKVEWQPMVAAAATPAEPAKPKRVNYRSAKARDARAKERGRLPYGSRVSAVWCDTPAVWAGSMTVFGTDGVAVYHGTASRDGLFRLMEDMDVTFWEWYAKLATAEEKAKIVFPAEDHKPEPMPPELAKGEA